MTNLVRRLLDASSQGVRHRHMQLAAGSAVAAEPNWWFLGFAAALVLGFLIFVLPKLLRQPPKPQAVAPLFTVSCTEERIEASHPDGQRESVRWEDVIIVAIRRDGDAASQQWWMVSGAGGKCWFPNDAQGLELARQQMNQRLRGFDDSVLAQLATGTCPVVVAWDKNKHPTRVAQG